MTDISGCVAGELGIEHDQSFDQSSLSIDRTNSIANYIRDGSNGYCKEQQLLDAVETNILPTFKVDANGRHQNAENRSRFQTECNKVNKDMNVVQDIEDRMKWNNCRMFNNSASEIDWNSIFKNLAQKSGAAGLRNYSFMSMNFFDQKKNEHFCDQQRLQRIHLQSTMQWCGRWQCSYDNHRSNEELENMHSFYNNGLDRVMQDNEGGLGCSEVMSSAITSIASVSRRLYHQGSKCTTPVEGIFTKNNPLCLRDVTKNPHLSRPDFCSKHVDYQPNSNAVRHAEGDYLFSEDLVQKRKFRLLIDRQREAQIRAEIYPPGFRLKDMIVMKYVSLGIPVEVESYHIQDQGKTNVKAFNIIFENSWDVKKAFDLVVRGQLFFSLREARPSPTYHVKYEVIYPAGVFEGKCFRQQQIHQLRKGDIVTTNQLKGNKVRIIKWCPVGSKVQIDISGWVLLRTKEMFLLRRIEHREEKQIMVKPESRSTILNPVLQNPKILGQPRRRKERHILHKCNSKRVSAANCSPFKVLVEVEVRKGRKESTIVGLLKPGRIAWANQHKGSMLRIMKMDHSGNLVYGSTMKPEVWGWVCLQRRGEKPRLLRILNTTVIKTKKTQEIPSPREKVRNKGYNFTDSQSQNQ